MNSHTFKKLECPFTWDLEGKEYPKSPHIEEEFEYYITVLISSIMNTYTLSKNGDNNSALLRLRETNEIWENLDKPSLQKEKVSLEVVYHILKATEYFVLKKENDLRNADKVLNTLEDFKCFKNPAELGTLYGCKSLALFYTKEENAMSLMRKAISIQPDCPLWHFLFAKQLRRNRRVTERLSRSKPSKEEIQEILTSYNMWKIPYYGIFAAQTFREIGDVDKAKEMYLDIYKMNPENHTIQLRLALGFLQMKEILFDHAESALDFVEKAMPDNVVLLHYRGIFFQKKLEYETAAKYFQKSAEKGNFRAELQYISCKRNLNKNFDCVKHLQSMLQKYENNYTNNKQNILLMMAIHYSKDKKDFVSASECLSQAISINPKSCYKWKKEFYNYIEDRSYKRLFVHIYKKLLSQCKENTKKLESSLNELENLFL